MFDRIKIVLVNTSHPGNIGAAARSMKTMGLSRLCLVAPQDYPHEYATSRAAGAEDVLDAAEVVSTLDEALADCSLVVGTSARGRKIPWPLLTPRNCADKVVSEASQHQVAIIFGREDRGLTNDELARCNYHVHIPANPDYSSLNLGSAVQVLAYEVRMSILALQEGALDLQEWDNELATGDDQERFYAHLQQLMEEVEFLDPENPGQIMTRLRRLYGRTRLDKVEVGILRGILSETQRQLKK